MSKDDIYLDSFSGTVVDLKKSLRNPQGVLYALKYHPMVSTFDLSENPWLVNAIEYLEKEGMLEHEDMGYPWHKYTLTEEGERGVFASQVDG